MSRLSFRFATHHDLQEHWRVLFLVTPNQNSMWVSNPGSTTSEMSTACCPDVRRSDFMTAVVSQGLDVECTRVFGWPLFGMRYFWGNWWRSADVRH